MGGAVSVEHHSARGNGTREQESRFMSGWCWFRLLSIKLTQSGALSLGMVAAGNEERDLLTG